uniref:Reverse transcriptase domain-containing protein n=1 Tax=Podarcis muralis TaxID=64176 RepID=A0A670J2Q0_PODMU
MAESEEELKNLLMRVKEESAKYGLKLNNKKTKITATGPITSRQIEGEEMEAVRDFTFLGSMITADGDSSHEIKRRPLLGRKAMTGLDSILKSRDITLPTKVRIVKAVVFPVVMYGSESWTIKKADRRRMDAFEFWCWRRLWRVPWTARRSNLSILKEISPECSLEGQILKLRLQDFGHLMRREDSLEKTLMLETMEGTRRRGRWRTRWWDSVLEATSMSLTKLGEAVEDRSAWRALVQGVMKRWTQLNNSTTTKIYLSSIYLSTYLPTYLPIHPATQVVQKSGPKSTPTKILLLFFHTDQKGKKTLSQFLDPVPSPLTQLHEVLGTTLTPKGSKVVTQWQHIYKKPDSRHFPKQPLRLPPPPRARKTTPTISPTHVPPPYIIRI